MGWSTDRQQQRGGVSDPLHTFLRLSDFSGYALQRRRHMHSCVYKRRLRCCPRGVQGQRTHVPCLLSRHRRFVLLGCLANRQQSSLNCDGRLSIVSPDSAPNVKYSSQRPARRGQYPKLNISILSLKLIAINYAITDRRGGGFADYCAALAYE